MARSLSYMGVKRAQDLVAVDHRPYGRVVVENEGPRIWIFLGAYTAVDRIEGSAG